MSGDRSGFVVPVVLAAWLLGVLWALSTLREGDAAHGAAASSTPGAAESPTAPSVALPSPLSPVLEVVEEYDPPRAVTFVEDGEYVGVKFDSSGSVTERLPAQISAGSTALTARQVRVNGESFYLIIDGLWAEWYVAADRLELAPAS